MITGVEETISAYTKSGNLITVSNAIDIRKVRNGMRVQAAGIPGGMTGTTIVEPGSITSNSFRLINAESGALTPPIIPEPDRPRKPGLKIC